MGGGKPLEERAAEAQEMRSQNASDLLNETAAQYNTNGRIRRDHFRGLPKEVYREGAAIVAEQQRMKAEAAAARKQEDMEHDQQVEISRRALVAVEKTRLEQYHDIVQNEMRQNKMPTLAEKLAMNKPSRGEIGDDFFKGFAASSR